MPRRTYKRGKKQGTRKKQTGGGVSQLITLKRKLQQRELNLKTLEESPLPKSFGPHMAKARQNEKNAKIKHITNEIANLQQRINILDPPKGRFVNINSIYVSPTITIDSLPVKFHMFINSPAIGGATPFGNSGPQYSKFEKKLLPQILALRSEAFPEEFGFGSQGLKDLMIKLFKQEVSPFPNAQYLIWLTPYHCEVKPDTPSEQNLIFSLVVVPPVDRNERLAYMGDIREPILLSSCSLIKCAVDDLEVFELYGLATFAKYQKMGLGKDLLLRVLQKLSNKNKGGPTNTRTIQDKYVWLFYKKEKEHLKKLYESVGFVPIDETSENPAHKKLYISPEFLLENARQAKLTAFKERVMWRNPNEIKVINEEDLPSFTETKKRELGKRLFDSLERSRKFSKNGVTFPKPTMLYYLPDEEISKIDVKRFFKDSQYQKELEELYFNIWYAHAIRVQFLVILSKEKRDEIMKLTEEEELKATEFIREEQQMVLSLADWVRGRLQ